jgi:hypothetical protein
MELPTGNFTELCGSVHVGRISRQLGFSKAAFSTCQTPPTLKGPLLVRDSARLRLRASVFETDVRGDSSHTFRRNAASGYERGSIVQKLTTEFKPLLKQTALGDSTEPDVRLPRSSPRAAADGDPVNG